MKSGDKDKSNSDGQKGSSLSMNPTSSKRQKVDNKDSSTVQSAKARVSGDVAGVIELS